MKYQVGLSAVYHGLGLMQKSPVDIMQSFVQKGLHRGLQEQAAAGDDFMSTMMVTADQCNLDLTQLTMIAMQSDVSPDEVALMTPADQIAEWNLIMGILNEESCTRAQTKQIIVAGKNVLQCIGIDLTNANATSAAIDPDTLQSMQDACNNVNDPTNTEALNGCTDSLLADPTVLYWSRDLYQHTGKYCTCLQTLAEDLPNCATTLGDLVEAAGQDWSTINVDDDTVDIDAYKEVIVPYGLVKSFACILGQECENLGQECLPELDTLETCMADFPGCQDVSTTCADSPFLNVPPLVSQGVLPDICVKALEDTQASAKKDMGVVGDFAKYIHTCYPDIETPTDATAVMEATSAAAPQSSSSSKATIANMPCKKATGMYVGIVVGVALVVALVAALLRKRRVQVQSFEQVEKEDMDAGLRLKEEMIMI